jgi:thiamine pyrophosphate-dependent acetolactate synthase large subunit-like protein
LEVVVNAVDVADALVRHAPDALFVASLGTATSALRKSSNDGPHLYFGGAMGSALAAALGVADAVPARQVVALLGDGELLMGASSLWSMSSLASRNLVGVVLADGRYSITGGQPLAGTTCFAEVANALPGLAGARAASIDELVNAFETIGRPGLVEAVIDDRAWPGWSPFVDPHVVRARFASTIADWPDAAVATQA